MNLLLVALGGAIGSAARYLVGEFIGNQFGPDFPWGTFIVNVSGSFFIGVVLSLVGGGMLPTEARPFLAVGILGGYTTFSTYSHESLQLIQGGEFGAVVFNALAQVEGIAGATVVHGIEGYGSHKQMHTARILDLSGDLPVVVTAVDVPEKIEAVLPKLDALIGQGLVTTEEVRVVVSRPPLRP